MELFDTISAQIDAVKLPLMAVTVTALPRVNTPVLLMLHWHGFRADPPVPVAPGTPVPHKAVPGSTLQMNPRWLDLGMLEGTVLDAAWQLGAWELDREERRACETPGAPDREALECRQAFGEPAFGGAGLVPPPVEEAPDRPEMLRAGARIGYVRWQFRPVRGGVWRDCADDDTLGADGGRRPPCPVAARASVGPRGVPVRYRLGHLDRIILR